MSKFDKVKNRLKKEWGYDLMRGSSNQPHGYKTGFFVIGKLYEQRFDTLQAIVNALDYKDFD